MKARAAQVTAQRTFAAPDDAAAALVDAVKRDDVNDLRAIFGPDADAMLDSGDPVGDAEGDSDGDTEGDSDADGERLGDSDGDSLADALADADLDALADALLDSGTGPLSRNNK